MAIFGNAYIRNLSDSFNDILGADLHPRAKCRMESYRRYSRNVHDYAFWLGNVDYYSCGVAQYNWAWYCNLQIEPQTISSFGGRLRYFWLVLAKIFRGNDGHMMAHNKAIYGELLFRRLNYGKKDCHNLNNYKAAA